MEHRFVAEGLISSALGLKPLCCSDIKDGIPALQAEFCSDQHNLLGQLEMQLWAPWQWNFVSVPLHILQSKLYMGRFERLRRVSDSSLGVPVSQLQEDCLKAILPTTSTNHSTLDSTAYLEMQG